jgi:hypothetical protein
MWCVAWYWLRLRMVTMDVDKCWAYPLDRWVASSCGAHWEGVVVWWVVPNLSSWWFANQILLVPESKWCGADDEHASLNLMKTSGWGVQCEKIVAIFIILVTKENAAALSALRKVVLEDSASLSRGTLPGTPVFWVLSSGRGGLVAWKKGAKG